MVYSCIKIIFLYFCVHSPLDDLLGTAATVMIGASPHCREYRDWHTFFAK